METAAICTGEMAIGSAVERSRNTFPVDRIGNTGIILAAEIIEVVDARRHVRPVLLGDTTIPSDVQRAVRSNSRKALEILSLQRSCTGTEDDSLVLSIASTGNPFPAFSIIEPENG